MTERSPVTMDQLRAARAARLQAEGQFGVPVRHRDPNAGPAEVVPLFGSNPGVRLAMADVVTRLHDRGLPEELGVFGARQEYYDALAASSAITNREKKRAARKRAAESVIYEALDNPDDPLWQELRGLAVDDLTKMYGATRAAKMLERVRLTHQTMSRQESSPQE